MMTRAPHALALLLALTACAAPIAPPDPMAEDACGASGFASLIGQDASVLLATTFTTQIRIIRPGDMVTEDYSRERANFAIGADERILGVTCG